MTQLRITNKLDYSVLHLISERLKHLQEIRVILHYYIDEIKGEYSFILNADKVEYVTKDDDIKELR